MAVQTSGIFGALSDQVMKTIEDFSRAGLVENEAVHKKLFNAASTTAKFKRFQSIAPLGTAPRKGEGEEYTFDQIQAGYSKDITPLEYGFGFMWTETAMEDDDFEVLAQYSKWLGFSMRVMQETQAAAVFNNAFTTQTTADGIALCSTAHTLKRGGTAKNRPSSDADLSVTSLSQAFIDLDTDTKLESGQIVMPSKGYYLVVAPANRFNALRIVKSVKDPESSMNAINPLSDLDITVVVNPFLTTDTDAWYMVAKDKDANGLLHLERKAMHQPPAMTDPRTGNRLYKLRERGVWDAVDWRNSYASVGA